MNSQVSGNLQLWAAIVELPYSYSQYPDPVRTDASNDTKNTGCRPAAADFEEKRFCRHHFLREKWPPSSNVKDIESHDDTDHHLSTNNYKKEK